MTIDADDQRLDLRVSAALTEFTAIRAQILLSVRRSHDLALFGVGGTGGVLTAIAGFRLDPELTLIAVLLATAGLAILALAYVGNFGEMLQAGDYVLRLGAWVRSELADPDHPLGDDAPLLRFEDTMENRTRAEPWSRLASTLATFEMGATVVMAVGLLVWASYTYAAFEASRSLLAGGLLVGTSPSPC